jgi:hypothetical protein
VHDAHFTSRSLATSRTAAPLSASTKQRQKPLHVVARYWELVEKSTDRIGESCDTAAPLRAKPSLALYRYTLLSKLPKHRTAPLGLHAVQVSGFLPSVVPAA